MPFNGAGVFQRVRNWVADATAGIKIRADFHDAEDDGFAAGLSTCITKNGQTIITENIPWNSKRITGLADPINPQDASTKAYADTKIPAGGGTSTGDMTITKGAPTLVLNDTSGGGASVTGQKSGKMRWLMRLGNNNPETGANAGSNFDLHRYDDAGGYLGQALIINRTDGAWTFGGPGIVTGALNVSGAMYVGASLTVAYGIVAATHAPDAAGGEVATAAWVRNYAPRTPGLYAGIPIIANPGVTDASHDQKCIVGSGGVTINGPAHAIGTCITFYAEADTLPIVNNEAMYWHSPTGGVAGDRTLARRGVASVLKIAAGHWVISGNGLT